MSNENPWEVQRALMKASGQFLPNSPVLTKESLLYVALILEETAEMLNEGVLPPLGRFLGQQPGRISGYRADEGNLLILAEELQAVMEQMSATSLHVRDILAKRMPGFALPMTRSEAMGALDGTTDLTVVNCGFALSCGLPGAAAYAEVARSNLSKRNPISGVIDKTPDGKWIKGSHYSPPDLGPLLDAALAPK